MRRALVVDLPDQSQKHGNPDPGEGSPPHCRGCKGSHVEALGALPDQSEFAGTSLQCALSGGSLFRCLDCCLVFRSPVLTAQEYNALYAQVGADVWAAPGSTLRSDQKLVRDFIVSHLPAGATVLDVGCYTGSLLSALPDHYGLFGVEKSAQAADVSRSNGIQIVGDDLYAVASQSRKFNAIVAMDVIEHTLDPNRFVQDLLSVLADDGMILITTGDADNWVWRQARGAFWYCSFLEHISFISKRWLQKNAVANGYRVSHLQTFDYEPLAWAKKLVKRALIYWCGMLGSRPKRSWTVHISRDHLFAVIVRG